MIAYGSSRCHCSIEMFGKITPDLSCLQRQDVVSVRVIAWSVLQAASHCKSLSVSVESRWEFGGAQAFSETPAATYRS